MKIKDQIIQAVLPYVPNAVNKKIAYVNIYNCDLDNDEFKGFIRFEKDDALYLFKVDYDDINNFYLMSLETEIQTTKTEIIYKLGK